MSDMELENSSVEENFVQIVAPQATSLKSASPSPQPASSNQAHASPKPVPASPKPASPKKESSKPASSKPASSSNQSSLPTASSKPASSSNQSSLPTASSSTTPSSASSNQESSLKPASSFKSSPTSKPSSSSKQASCSTLYSFGKLSGYNLRYPGYHLRDECPKMKNNKQVTIDSGIARDKYEASRWRWIMAVKYKEIMNDRAHCFYDDYKQAENERANYNKILSGLSKENSGDVEKMIQRAVDKAYTAKEKYYKANNLKRQAKTIMKQLQAVDNPKPDSVLLLADNFRQYDDCVHGRPCLECDAGLLCLFGECFSCSLRRSFETDEYIPGLFEKTTLRTLTRAQQIFLGIKKKSGHNENDEKVSGDPYYNQEYTSAGPSKSQEKEEKQSGDAYQSGYNAYETPGGPSKSQAKHEKQSGDAYQSGFNAYETPGGPSKSQARHRKGYSPDADDTYSGPSKSQAYHRKGYSPDDTYPGQKKQSDDIRKSGYNSYETPGGPSSSQHKQAKQSDDRYGTYAGPSISQHAKQAHHRHRSGYNPYEKQSQDEQKRSNYNAYNTPGGPSTSQHISNSPDDRSNYKPSQPVYNNYGQSYPQFVPPPPYPAHFVQYGYIPPQQQPANQHHAQQQPAHQPPAHQQHAHQTPEYDSYNDYSSDNDDASGLIEHHWSDPIEFEHPGPFECYQYSRKEAYNILKIAGFYDDTHGIRKIKWMAESYLKKGSYAITAGTDQRKIIEEYRDHLWVVFSDSYIWPLKKEDALEKENACKKLIHHPVMRSGISRTFTHFRNRQISMDYNRLQALLEMANQPALLKYRVGIYFDALQIFYASARGGIMLPGYYTGVVEKYDIYQGRGEISCTALTGSRPMSIWFYWPNILSDLQYWCIRQFAQVRFNLMITGEFELRAIRITSVTGSWVTRPVKEKYLAESKKLIDKKICIE